MLSRGHIIGKIVDDLAGLQYQLDMRNKLGQSDLSRFCEDFFKEILNIVYDLNLTNLNTIRSNEPGLDLGDKTERVAYQVTSQKTSTKVNDTLAAISDHHVKLYDTFHVLVIDKKQSSYTIDKKLAKKYKFTEKENIIDIPKLLRDIVVLEFDKLEMLFNLFRNEFRQVRIELEPVDEKGNFESSYYNTIEQKPASPPKNAEKFLGEKTITGYQKEFKELLHLYARLASVPRVTREILAIIVERGKYGPAKNISRKYGILPKVLEKLLHMSENELRGEIDILEMAGLVTTDEGEIGEREAVFIVVCGSRLNELFQWMDEQSLSIKMLLNKMDFSILDNEE
jgi:hypothetical protein